MNFFKKSFAIVFASVFSLCTCFATPSGQPGYTLKLTFLGNGGVRKINIIQCMVNGCSSNELISVVAYSEMKFKLKNDKFANLQIWDTAGQDDFQCLAPMYLRKSNCVFIVFDVTSEESFKSIHRWLEVLKDNAGQDLSQIVISILANNIDSLSDRVVFSDEGMAQVNSWSKEYEIHIGYYEVSSNTSMGISETLSEVVHKAVEKYDNRPRVEQVPLVEPVRLKDTADTAKKGGCA